MNRTSSLPALIERFFTERLMRQQRASTHTIASYRDTFRLLLGFASQRRKKSPSELELRDLDARSLSNFWMIRRHSVPPAHGLGTCVSRQFVPSSDSWPSKNPLTLRTSNGCWRSPASGVRRSSFIS